MAILTNFLMQIGFSVGIVVLFGLLMALSRRLFCRIAGNAGVKILLATGIVGTPVHELSHALFCLLFGHKIMAIKLYDPSCNDGTLGYVSHSYNPKNIYQQIGNFFIGIAPIIGGSGVIILLMYLCTPQLFADVFERMAVVFQLKINDFNFETYKTLFSELWGMIVCVFHYSNFKNALWWLFIVLSIMIAGHMELSGADMLSGLKGFAFIAVILLLADVIMYFVSVSALESVTAAMVSFAAMISGFLAVSLIFAVALIIIAVFVRIIVKLFTWRR